MAKRSDRQFRVLRRIREIIPPHLVPMLARAHGVDRAERGISSWSHMVLLLLAQLTHAIGLNDVCDSAAGASKPFSKRSSRHLKSAYSYIRVRLTLGFSFLDSRLRGNDAQK